MTNNNATGGPAGTASSLHAQANALGGTGAMTDKLRQDELEAFKQAFDMFDKNSDGTISTKVGLSGGWVYGCAYHAGFLRKNFPASCIFW